MRPAGWTATATASKPRGGKTHKVRWKTASDAGADLSWNPGSGTPGMGATAALSTAACGTPAGAAVVAATSGNCFLKVASSSSPGFWALVLYRGHTSQLKAGTGAKRFRDGATTRSVCAGSRVVQLFWSVHEGDEAWRSLPLAKHLESRYVLSSDSNSVVVFSAGIVPNLSNLFLASDRLIRILALV